MEEITENVHLIQWLRGANVYLLVSDTGLTLVDTGGPGDSEQIVSQMDEAGYPISDLSDIVLTHAHGDHTANVLELSHRSGAQVLAHREEVPYVERTASMPVGSIFKKLLFWFADRYFFNQPACEVDRELEDGDILPSLGGLQVIHTPGHTPGSICLYQPERKILFCGDLMFNINPVTGKPGLIKAIPLVSGDVAGVDLSIKKVSELPVETIFFGHGEPILDRGAEQIAELLG